MPKFIVVQIAPRKFIVAERALVTGVYRRVCECHTEYTARQLMEALITAN